MSEIKINNIPVITENNGSVELTTGSVITDTIYESTAGSGVTIDGLKIKDTGIQVGGLEGVNINSSGHVTMPYQPAFSSVKNGHQYPVSGSRDVITPWTSQLNIGGHFNNSTGVFTAPVSGTYFFYVSIMSDRNDSGDYQISIHKNGTMYVNSNDLHTANATYVQTTVPCVIYVPQNDTVDFRLYNSTLTATFIYSGNYSHCGGYLIG